LLEPLLVGEAVVVIGEVVKILGEINVLLIGGVLLNIDDLRDGHFNIKF